MIDIDDINYLYWHTDMVICDCRLLAVVQVHVVNRAVDKLSQLTPQASQSIVDSNEQTIVHSVPQTTDVSSTMIRHLTPDGTILPPINISLPFTNQSISIRLFPKTSAGLVLERELAPEVLSYIQQHQLYMYSKKEVSKRNRVRVYFAMHCAALAYLIWH